MPTCIDGRTDRRTYHFWENKLYFQNISKTNQYFFLIVSLSFRRGWRKLCVKNSKKTITLILFSFRTIQTWFLEISQKRINIFSWLFCIFLEKVKNPEIIFWEKNSSPRYCSALQCVAVITEINLETKEILISFFQHTLIYHIFFLVTGAIFNTF